jgi:hypothetical protein
MIKPLRSSYICLHFEHGINLIAQQEFQEIRSQESGSLLQKYGLDHRA